MAVVGLPNIEVAALPVTVSQAKTSAVARPSIQVAALPLVENKTSKAGVPNVQVAALAVSSPPFPSSRAVSVAATFDIDVQSATSVDGNTTIGLDGNAGPAPVRSWILGTIPICV